MILPILTSLSLGTEGVAIEDTTPPLSLLIIVPYNFFQLYHTNKILSNDIFIVTYNLYFNQYT
jgi:hypothetical protein